MSNSPKNSRKIGIATIVVLILFIGITILFLILFALASRSPNTQQQDTITENIYMDEVNSLLADVDVGRGETLLTQYQCSICHIQASEQIAPPFFGLVNRASERRPPMQAVAYIYESIIHPSAYLVADYEDAMPKNYAERISDAELGDILAYLLATYP